MLRRRFEIDNLVDGVLAVAQSATVWVERVSDAAAVFGTAQAPVAMEAATTGRYWVLSGEVFTAGVAYRAHYAITQLDGRVATGDDDFTIPAAAATDAYITRDEASALLTGLVAAHPGRVAFEALGGADQDALLHQASDMIDAVAWLGRPASSDQPRAWPRRYSPGGRYIEPDPAETGDEPFTSIPRRLRRAVAHQAAHLAALAAGVGAAREIEEAANRGATSVSAGGRSISLNLQRANSPWAAIGIDAQRLLHRYRAVALEGV